MSFVVIYSIQSNPVDTFAQSLQSIAAGVHQASPEQIYQDIKKVVDDQYGKKTYQQNFETAQSFTAKDLIETADAFIAKMADRLQHAQWIKGGTPDYLFVRKLILPAGSEIEFRGDLHGDVRSLIRWLDDLQAKGWLDKNNIFKLVNKNQYLSFLGDYTDRGHYGAEVMYIIMQLFLHNPDNVLIVRGNHEDEKVVSVYGFLAGGAYGYNYNLGELAQKFDKNKENKDKLFIYEGKAVKQIMNIYNYLPVALFLGCPNAKGDGRDFIQCCHGGMEPLYNSKPLLEDSAKDLYERLDKRLEDERDEVPCVLHVNVKNLLAQCDCNKQQCSNNGFQWNDFDFFNEEPNGTWYFYPGRGRVMHKKLVTEILKYAGGKNHVWAVFRAHQHNHETILQILNYGNGLYKLWSEKTTNAQDWGNKKSTGNIQWIGDGSKTVPLEKYSVWTFNVAPRTGSYEKNISDQFTYDTVARLTLKPGFDNWILQPRQINVG